MMYGCRFMALRNRQVILGYFLPFYLHGESESQNFQKKKTQSYCDFTSMYQSYNVWLQRYRWDRLFWVNFCSFTLSPRVFFTGGKRESPINQKIAHSPHLEKIPHQRLIPPLNNNFFFFILFVHTAQANFDPNLCSIFTEC